MDFIDILEKQEPIKQSCDGRTCTSLVSLEMDPLNFTSQKNDETMVGNDTFKHYVTESQTANDSNDSDLESDEQDGEKSTESLHEQPPVNRHKFADIFNEISAVTFRCCGCKTSCATLDELRAHSETIHSMNSVSIDLLKGKKQCEICFKILSNNSSYKNHQKINKIDFQCKICGDIFSARKRVLSHYKRLHGPNTRVSDEYRTCCGCVEKFETRDALKAHSDKVHLPEKPPPNENRPFVCQICFHNFTNEKHLYAHQIRRVKYAKIHQCTQCGKTFTGASILRDHEIFHRGDQSFQCMHCSMTFSNRDTYRRHVRRHTNQADQYRCEECPRRFKTRKNLLEHALLHTGERPLVCPYCPKTFARDSCFKFHVRIHTGKKKFPCPQCRRNFSCSSDRNRHVRLFHERQRPFPCFYCSNTYPRKDYRRKHVESTHAQELLENPVPELELSGSKRWQ
ncbi:zinc finger protein OZF-like [Malaya genurostris]|uniref:zinc finger protein OZF-like n=1 Tax=Malaya genurostris TaxID=325434 RepID=UPI0026F3BE3A|nr:zinc finger protein OZF-like [Malaya genurostris]